MWDKKEKGNKERGELGPSLEAHLSALAAEKGIELEFSDHQAPFDFLRQVQRTADFGFMEGPYFVKVRMITGRMKGHWKSVTGGYLMEHFLRGAKGSVTAILGGALDYDAKTEKGEAGKHPLFISALDKDTFSVSKERRPALFGPSGNAEQIVWVSLVGDKMEEIVGIIERGLKGEAEPRVVVVAPRLDNAGWDPSSGEVHRTGRRMRIISGDDESEIRFAAPKAKVIGPITPNISPEEAQKLGQLFTDLARRSLSGELGEASKGGEVRIEGLPDSLPEEIVERLESGIRVLGTRMEEFKYGQRYEDQREKKRTTWIYAGLREEGQLAVQVEEDLKNNGRLKLVIGVIRLIGEGEKV